MSLLDRLEDTHTWVWPLTFVLLGLLFALVYYVPMARKARFLREMRLEQNMEDTKVARFVRTEQMWRDFATRATLRGDTELADYYGKCADEICELYDD